MDSPTSREAQLIGHPANSTTNNEGAQPPLPQLSPSCQRYVGRGQKDLLTHSKLHIPVVFVKVLFLVRLGTCHTLSGKCQALLHNPGYFSGSRGLRTHPTSQIQGLPELLPVGKGIRSSLGAGGVMCIDAHLTE